MIGVALVILCIGLWWMIGEKIIMFKPKRNDKRRI